MKVIQTNAFVNAWHAHRDERWCETSFSLIPLTSVRQRTVFRHGCARLISAWWCSSWLRLCEVFRMGKQHQSRTSSTDSQTIKRMRNWNRTIDRNEVGKNARQIKTQRANREPDKSRRTNCRSDDLLVSVETMWNKKIKLYVKRQKRIKLQRTEQPMPFASYVLSTKAVYSRMERRCSQSNTANTANCTSNRRERLTCYSTTIFTQ